jgi:LacI family transcriptional regulator
MDPRNGETISQATAGVRAPNGRRATMKQVAALAGVSLSTVSRVVNEDPVVRPDLAARVRSAVEALDYRHNAAASALRRADGLSASIGVIVDDVADPFFCSLQRAVEDVARERRVLTFTGSSDGDPARERWLAEAFGSRGVDGLIIAPASSDHAFLLRDRAAGMALVFVDRPAAAIDADAVLSDEVGAATQVVEHLVSAGHRRIVFVADRSRTAGSLRRGYESGLARYGLGADLGVVALIGARAAGAYEVTRELLLGDDPPTALFTSDHRITMDAVRALRDLGLQRRVALVGFGAVALADVVEPGLTLLEQDRAQVGRAAAELLFARLDGFDGPPQQIVLSPRLVARGSGELPAPVAA